MTGSKGIFTLYFSVLCILSLRTNAQEKAGYTIHGYLGGLKEGEKVTMLLSNAKGLGPFVNYLSRRDSAYVKNGEFIIKGDVPEGPRRYVMIFDKHDGNVGEEREIGLFINNGEQIVIRHENISKISHASMGHYVDIEGSPTHHSMMCLATAEELFYQAQGGIKNQAKKIMDSVGFSGPLLDMLFSMKARMNRLYYYSVLDTAQTDPTVKKANLFLPLDFSDFDASGHASFWVDVYNELDEQLRNGFLGKWLKERIALCIGQPFPPFTLPTVDNKSVASKDVISQGKLTLVHFWATNSAKRQDLQEELKILYRKYQGKGLNVIAISTDKYLEEWRETLKTAQLPWINVVDPGGKLVEKTYYEYGGPRAEHTTNVLIDAQGKIVAWNVYGPELQWYLWKILGE